MKTILPKTFLKAAFLLWLVLLTACAPAVPQTIVPTVVPLATATHQVTSREAQVQTVEVQISQSSPVLVSAIVHGKLTESCATLGESQVQYASNIFKITVFTNSPADIGCAQATTQFETTIPLDTKDLPAGSYIAVANGISAGFTLPLDNPTPTSEPTLIVSMPTSSACIDSAAFVTDVTILDNSVLSPNTPFTKTWRIKNAGTCTWDSSYLVAYISGATMSQQPGYWILQQGQTVAPNETVNVNVGMTSPVENGSYVSYWGLKKENGQLIPIQGGANGNSFYVKIKVNDGSTTNGNITAASIDIEQEQGSGTDCNAEATYFVHAYITSDGPATASYEINSTAGQIAAGNFETSPGGPVSPVITGTIVFDQADTKRINLRFVGPYPYPTDITVNLRVNGGEWHNTKLTCQ